MAEGIERRGDSFRAVVRVGGRSGRKLTATFDTERQAKAWRARVIAGLESGAVSSTPSSATVREAAEVWLADAAAGIARTRSGDAYKPRALQAYEAALRLRILPALGGAKLTEVKRRDVQRIADEILAAGAAPPSIRNALMPLRVIYRRALEDGVVSVNPCAGVRMPAVRSLRERIASPEEAAQLIEALPRLVDRALWATAFYAGLRRGELAALRWEDVDIAAGRIRVDRAWGEHGGFVEPKTRAGKRTVPMAGALRDALAEFRADRLADCYAPRDGLLVFGATFERPFTPSAVRKRALKVWAAAGLTPIGLHEARHTFASLCIAAGVNAKAISTYMGHSSIEVTFNLYGKLMPGNEDEAAELLDAYLSRADTASRLRQVDA